MSEGRIIAGGLAPPRPLSRAVVQTRILDGLKRQKDAALERMMLCPACAAHRSGCARLDAEIVRMQGVLAATKAREG